MALREYPWTYVQTQAESTWNIVSADVGIPSNAQFISATEIFADGGEIIQPVSQLVSPDGIQLSFGVQSESGTAVGKYYLEVPDDPQVVQDGYGNNVTITVTQNGGTPTGTTF